EHARVPRHRAVGRPEGRAGRAQLDRRDGGRLDAGHGARARGAALRSIGVMKIAAVQMVSTPSVERNLETARRLVARAAADGATMVVLPEYFCFMGKADRDKLAIAEAPGEGPIQRTLADSARENGVWLIGGTLPLTLDAAGHGNAGAVDRVMNA